MKTYVCDRIEGEIVILVDEKGDCRSIPLDRFPVRPSEGMVLRADLTCDPEATAARSARMSSLFARLRKKGN